jgi:hypothetical protein
MLTKLAGKMEIMPLVNASRLAIPERDQMIEIMHFSTSNFIARVSGA